MNELIAVTAVVADPARVEGDLVRSSREGAADDVVRWIRTGDVDAGVSVGQRRAQRTDPDFVSGDLVFARIVERDPEQVAADHVPADRVPVSQRSEIDARACVSDRLGPAYIGADVVADHPICGCVLCDHHPEGVSADDIAFRRAHAANEVVHRIGADADALPVADCRRAAGVRTDVIAGDDVVGRHVRGDSVEDDPASGEAVDRHVLDRHTLTGSGLVCANDQATECVAGQTAVDFDLRTGGIRVSRRRGLCGSVNDEVGSENSWQLARRLDREIAAGGNGRRDLKDNRATAGARCRVHRCDRVSQ